MKLGKIIIQGGIHTAEYKFKDYVVRPGEGGMLLNQARYGKAWDKVSTRKKRGTQEVDTYAKFNPNATRFGRCKNLACYCVVLDKATRACEMPDTKSLCRVDFSVDCNSEDGKYTKVIKLGDLMVDCFIARKKIKPNHEGTKHSRTTGEHLHTHAKTKTLEVMLYNKGIQKPDEGVKYRLEFRRKDQRSRDAGGSLQLLAREISSWRNYLPQALQATNNLLVKKWRATRPRTKDGQSVPEFIRANMGLIYTRGQLVQLFEMLGQTAKQAETSTRNFIHRNSLELVTEQEVAEFFSAIVALIDAYLEDEDISSVRVFGKEQWENKRVSGF